MSHSNACNRIFWEAAVECLHFGSRNALNPYPAPTDRRNLLFELARQHADANQRTSKNADTAPLLTALMPLLPPELQGRTALKILNELAQTAVLIRAQQAMATDIQASHEARSNAQAEVDKLLTRRASLSEALDRLTS